MIQSKHVALKELKIFCKRKHFVRSTILYRILKRNAHTQSIFDMKQYTKTKSWTFLATHRLQYNRINQKKQIIIMI